jgi:hypothetical protein
MTPVLQGNVSIALMHLQYNALPTLPVAPQHASRASNITTVLLLHLPSSLASCRYLTILEPVIPLPTITISASVGSFSVVRWPSKTLDGSLCQKDFDELGTGRPDGSSVEAGGMLLAESEELLITISEITNRLEDDSTVQLVLIVVAERRYSLTLELLELPRATNRPHGDCGDRTCCRTTTPISSSSHQIV